MATGLPVAKALIKYNNSLEEKDEEEREPINIELTEQKTDPYNDENAIYLKWPGVKEEDDEDIALVNFIENLQKQTDEENFPKSSCMIVWWLQYRT